MNLSFILYSPNLSTRGQNLEYMAINDPPPLHCSKPCQTDNEMKLVFCQFLLSFIRSKEDCKTVYTETL